MSHDLALTAKTIHADITRTDSRSSDAQSRAAGGGSPLKDRILFMSLVRAHKAQTMTILVRAARLNQPGSPLWDPIDNIAPLVCILLVAGLVFAAINLLAGTAAIVLGILLYVILIRPFILRVVQERAIESAIGHVHNWELLWKQGGLILRAPAANGATCLSPAGDWRAYVQEHSPILAADGAANYNLFRTAKPLRDRFAGAEVDF